MKIKNVFFYIFCFEKVKNYFINKFILYSYFYLSNQLYINQIQSNLNLLHKDHQFESQILGLLETYMIVNFKVRRISRDTYKLTQISILIKKIQSNLRLNSEVLHYDIVLKSGSWNLLIYKFSC
jgi:uncharacterized membrane protein YcgQ (UPF0703/DUF1980 family)